MTRNQILAQYLTVEINHPAGENQNAKLKDFYYSKTIPEVVADYMISKLPEEKLDELKRIAKADYQSRGEKLIFLDSFPFH